MQDCANEQGVTGFLPMIPALERAFGINENVGDILGVPDLAVALADLKQRIIGRARLIGRIEQQHRSKAGPPTGGQLKIFALDIVDDRRERPSQERRNDQTYALARTGWGKAQDVLGAGVSEIPAIEAAEHDSVVPQKARSLDLPYIGPARRAVCRDLLGFPRPPDRQRDGDDDSSESAACGNAGALDEYSGRIGVELEPPDEKRNRLIHRPVPNREPGWAELRLKGETPGRPFGGAPEECKHDDGDEKQLPPENFGRGHERAHAPHRGLVQRSYSSCRKRSHRGAEIGRSKGKVALASKTPVDATGTGDAAYMHAKFTLKRRCPGHELEAQAAVDHRKPAGGKRQFSAIDPRNGLAGLSRHMRQPRFLRQAPTHAVELPVAQGPDQIAADNELISVPANQTLF